MADPRMRVNGPCDNRSFYRAWLKTDVIFDQLFLSGISHKPFNLEFIDPFVPTMAYLAWYGRHLCVNQGKPVNRTNVLVGMWADVMGPCIGSDRIPDQDESRKIFKASIRALVQDGVLGIIGDASVESYRKEAAQEDHSAFEDIRGGGWEQVDIKKSVGVLQHLASRAGPAFSCGGVGMIVHVYLAVLKRGTISEAFADKISAGLATDLQITNLRIDVEACKVFYSIFGGLVTDVTIAEITTRWELLLPTPALRLRLTVAQASGSGLTALSVTGRAIRTYTDFDWGRIREIYGDEWANFTTAVQTVGENHWYGFRKDLSIVASTKYKNLSYVAKELLTKVNGESSLKNYGGWTRRAKYQGTVDLLIANYETDKARNVVEGAAMPLIRVDPAVIELRALIERAPTVYV